MWRTGGEHRRRGSVPAFLRLAAYGRHGHGATLTRVAPSNTVGHIDVTSGQPA